MNTAIPTSNISFVNVFYLLVLISFEGFLGKNLEIRNNVSDKRNMLKTIMITYLKMVAEKTTIFFATCRAYSDLGLSIP